MKKPLLGILVILTCTVYFIILALLINHSIKTYVDTKAIQTIFSVPIRNFQPEPQERILFLTATLSIPFVCGLAYLYLGKAISNGKLAIKRKTYRFINLLSMASIAGLAFWGIRSSEFSYLGTSSLIQAPIITLIFNSVIMTSVFLSKSWIIDNSLIRKNIPKLIYFSLGCILVGLIFAETIFNEYEPYVAHIDFIAYFDSVVQVYLGKTLLVDFSAQYGLYALLLAPIFKIIGLNVLKFTIIMGILKIIIYTSILLVLWQVTQNKLVGLMGFVTIIFYSRMRVPLDVIKDPYFQYNPHRMIFPALLILLVWLYLTWKESAWRKPIYILITILCPVSILWNPDTGIVVMLAWLIFLIYRELLFLRQENVNLIIKNCVNHIAFNFWSATVIFSGFYVYTYIFSGLLPDIASSAEYTKLFYFYGFYMLPMPAIHPWNMVILSYGVGLFISISYLLEINRRHNYDKPSEKNQNVTLLVFILSILGIGLFNYYVGRSHDLNLIGPTWPMFILIIIFTDQLFSQLSSQIFNQMKGFQIKLLVIFRKDFKAFLFVGLFYFLSSSLLSVALNMPAYLNVISVRWADVVKGRPHPLNTEVDFIKSTSNITDKIFILSDFAPELYLYSNHARPINIAGFGELILKKDIDKVKSFLAHPPKGTKIYWEPDFKTFRPTDYNNLHLVASAKHEYIFLFEDQNP